MVMENSVFSECTSIQKTTTSQGYFKIVTTESRERTAVSSTHSESSQSLPTDDHGAILTPLTPNVTERVNLPSEHDLEQNEQMTFKDASDIADRSLGTQTHSRFRAAREVIVKYWFWEAAACLFSLLSLASILGVLIYEDGKPLDTWEWAIPPTATVSFIGTLSKASLVLVLSQILSQLKWLHFGEAKSLRDIRDFDAASRGPLGAALVMWNSKKLWASIGACLMILTILVDPFVQLVFTFPSKLVEDRSQQAVFQSANSWSGGLEDVYDPMIALPSQSIVTSINEGLSSTNIVPATICPSGNCIWPDPIKTLGVCGSCSDVAPSVITSCFTTYNKTVHGECSDASDLPLDWCMFLSQNETDGLGTKVIQTCNYTWQDSHTIQAHKYTGTLAVSWDDNLDAIAVRTVWNSTSSSLYHMQNITIVEPLSANVTFELNGESVGQLQVGLLEPRNGSNPPLSLLSYPLSSFYAIQLPGLVLEERDEIPAAKCWSCELYWCEKTFESVRITDNAAPMYTVSTQRLWFVPGGGFLMYGLLPGNNSMFNETIWNFQYLVNQTDIDDLANLFQSYFVQYLYQGHQRPQLWGEPPDSQADLASNAQAILGLVFSKDMNTSIQRLADSLTEVIRSGPNSTNITGQTLVMKSFIQVRWTWLALPLALVTTTSILLLIVSIKSHIDGTSVWKDDPLALLFHSVHGTHILPGSHIGTSDLDNLADEVCVRLDQDKPFQFVVSTEHNTRNTSFRSGRGWLR